ncbi:MAG: hypothetical protein AAF191_18575, partial [Verrucomicrobiota bacterium]
AVDAAAERYFERARVAYNDGSALAYDFSMGTVEEEKVTLANLFEAEEGRLADPDRYFCSAVASEIFAEAGLELFPKAIQTRVNQGAPTRTLFQSWGIDTDQPVTAPGDTDLSPILLRYAEGTRLDGIEANHLQQVVLTQVFRWMDEDGYELRWPTKVSFKTALFSFLHRIHLDLGIVPDGMNRGMLNSLLALDGGSEVYRKELTRANEAFRAKRGRGMVPSEMVQHLRRTRDEVRWRRRWLRPPEDGEPVTQLASE